MKKIIIVVLMFLSLFLTEEVIAQPVVGGIPNGPSFVSPSSSTVYNPGGDFSSVYRGSIETYWPALGDPESCFASQDLLVQVSPAGCQPAVVRSDLLAEQNVPVFCQLDALKVNPFIDIKRIRNIRFNSEYPPEVQGVGFHPARAALRSDRVLLGSPLIDNIGYVVVVLRRNEIESSLPDSVGLTLNAQVEYDSGNAFGIGRAEFLLEKLTDEQWALEKDKQSFWQGRYFVRLEEVDSNEATISLYNGERRVASRTVERGKTSGDVFLPGLYCQSALQIRYDGFESVDATARIAVDDDILEVTQGSRFLNNKCSVTSISQGIVNNGSVTIKCGSETETLRINTKALQIGDEIVRVDSNGFDLENGDPYNILNITGNDLLISKDLGKSNLTVSLNDIRPVGDDKLFEAQYSGKLGEYLRSAILEYESVADDYPAERENDVGEFYGALALQKAIDLADFYNLQFTHAELIRKLLEKYPTFSNSSYYQLQLNDLYRKDKTEAGVAIEIDNRVVPIQLLDFKILTRRDTASFLVGSNTELKAERGGSEEAIKIGGDTLGTFRLDSVDDNSAKITAFCLTKDNGGNTVRSRGRTFSFNIGESKEVCTQSLQLKEVEANGLAKVSLVPNVRGTRSETPFTVNIGIEKRSIELTPDKVAEKLENLDESIEKWTQIANTLGDSVRALKGACFATAAVLTIKNFWDGLSGRSLARTHTMQGPNGWTKRCEQAVATGNLVLPNGEIESGKTYRNVQACFDANEGLIENEIVARIEAIDAVDERIGDVEEMEGITKKGFIESRVVVDKAKEEYIETMKSRHGNHPLLVKLSEGNNTRAVSYSDLRELDYNLELASRNSEFSGIAVDNFEIVETKVNERLDVLANTERANQIAASAGANAVLVGDLAVGRIARGNLALINSDGTRVGSKEVTGVNLGGLDVTHAMFVTGSGTVTEGGLTETVSGDYLVVGTMANGVLRPEKVYRVNDNNGRLELSRDEKFTDDTSKFRGAFKISTFEDLPGDFVYPIKASDRIVRFFDQGPYKGYAAQVPVRVEEGWYAKVDPVLPVGNNIASYTSAGEPKSFRLCNVGPDGFIGDDDACQRIDIGVSDNVGVFGLDSRKSRDLIREAQNALRQAAEQSDMNLLNINAQQLTRGVPISASTARNCQEFMDHEDCKILFNVCDPVICPPSRCDLGGKFPVADVIQTGIVGGAFMCLPNFVGFDGDVYLPVCLTGIHAGIDAYLSILESHAQCLQENLDTGRTVGICDEITSVYECEFFWRQMAPFAETLTIKFFEFLAGESGARGGGEYSNVQGAWDTAQGSFDFFTQNYAANSIEAFRIRSVAEAGTQVCQAFVSGQIPTNFDTLLDPDSPTQFHAYFDQTRFSDATVPATSQYKVFYHIYAGNDQGVAFSVYLKDPPTGGFFSVPPIVQVASGFISRGQFATESRDLTAPEGYKQLCVRINNQEECGFKQVSSSFAVNFIRDEFVSSEIERSDITSESECISGGTSLSAAEILQPNPQAALEGTLSPQAYERGIVRVCSNQNPGTGTDPSRFVPVGHCDDTRVTCWMDKRSVDNAITANNVFARNETLSTLNEQQQRVLREQGVILDDVEFSTEIDRIEDLVLKGTDGIKTENDGLILISEADDLLMRVLFNKEKAQIGTLKGDIYSVLARLFGGAIRRASDTVDADLGRGDPIINEDAESEGPVSQDSGEEGAPEPVEGEASSDLVLRGNRIYYNGEDTNIYLSENGARNFWINEENGAFLNFDRVIGDIFNGKINLDISLFEMTDAMMALHESEFDESNRVFIISFEEYDLATAYTDVQKLSGSYGDNEDFVDRLFLRKIISRNEYIDIIGEGVFNSEKDMEFVSNLLGNKLGLDEPRTTIEKFYRLVSDDRRTFNGVSTLRLVCGNEPLRINIYKRDAASIVYLVPDFGTGDVRDGIGQIGRFVEDGPIEMDDVKLNGIRDSIPSRELPHIYRIDGKTFSEIESESVRCDESVDIPETEVRPGFFEISDRTTNFDLRSISGSLGIVVSRNVMCDGEETRIYFTDSSNSPFIGFSPPLVFVDREGGSSRIIVQDYVFAIEENGIFELNQGNIRDALFSIDLTTRDYVERFDGARLSDLKDGIVQCKG